MIAAAADPREEGADHGGDDRHAADHERVLDDVRRREPDGAQEHHAATSVTA